VLHQFIENNVGGKGSVVASRLSILTPPCPRDGSCLVEIGGHGQRRQACLRGVFHPAKPMRTLLFNLSAVPELSTRPVCRGHRSVHRLAPPWLWIFTRRIGGVTRVMVPLAI